MGVQNISGLLAGIVFGAGLAIAGMTDPNKVLAFLTLTRDWDPSLVYVLGAAVVVAALGYRLVGSRAAPLFDEEFHAPSASNIDGRLLGGAALFGIGWGVAGFCPGPALVGVMTLDPRAAVFLVAFVAGMLIYERWFSAAPVPRVPDSATADG
jgi:uncharacterized membrane protein YedE/YeeE